MGIRQTSGMIVNYQEDCSCARNKLTCTYLKGWHDSYVLSSPFDLSAR